MRKLITITTFLILCWLGSAGPILASPREEFATLLREHWARAQQEQVFFRTDPDAFRLNGKPKGIPTAFTLTEVTDEVDRYITWPSSNTRVSDSCINLVTLSGFDNNFSTFSRISKPAPAFMVPGRMGTATPFHLPPVFYFDRIVLINGSPAWTM